MQRLKDSGHGKHNDGEAARRAESTPAFTFRILACRESARTRPSAAINTRALRPLESPLPRNTQFRRHRDDVVEAGRGTFR